MGERVGGGLSSGGGVGVCESNNTIMGMNEIKGENCDNFFREERERVIKVMGEMRCGGIDGLKESQRGRESERERE